jgi:hypothetical protein
MRFLPLLAFLPCLAFAAQLPSIEASAEASALIREDLEALSELGGDILAFPESHTRIVVEEFADKGLVDGNLCDDSTRKVYADVRGGRSMTIRLNAELVRQAQNNNTAFACKHGSFRQFLRATLWHELGHVWDARARFSNRGRFRALLGGEGRSGTGNRAGAASPDAYELTNLREAFAVNLEWFLLDPQFQCRRPALQRVLQDALGFAPHPTNACEINWSFPMQSQHLSDNFTRMASLDPARIYQVHYLFAGKGKAIMNNWGHAMLRVVVCAPVRTTVGPECLQDFSHHIVLSYRASVESPNLDYMDGMTGKYPSLMFSVRLNEVLQQYAKGELRELWSVPLQLSREQIDLFARVSLERYWGYQNKYFFLNNNCGTEAKRHLTAVSAEFTAPINDLTPVDMYKEFVRRAPGFREMQEDLPNMQRQGLYFPSQREAFETSLATLREAGLATAADMDAFLETTTAARLARYRAFPWATTPRARVNLLLEQVRYLERYAGSVFSTSVMKSIMKKVEDHPDLRARIESGTQAMFALVRHPRQVAGDGYGVPSLDGMTERHELWTREQASQQTATQAQQQELVTILLSHPAFADEKAQYDGLQEIGLFIQALRGTGV